MARSMRRAVKLFLLMNVLAATGAGVYYFTSSGGPAWFWRFFGASETAAELVADETSPAVQTALSRSDLDAVASAWASAEPIQGARFTEPAEVAAKPNLDPSPAPDRSVASRTAVADSDDRYGPSAPLPAAFPAEDARSAGALPVTRGQQPNEDGDDEMIDADEEPGGPNPLGSEPGGTASSQRAREAFADVRTAADDRYSASAADPRGKAADDAALPPNVNPFASPSAANPFSTTPGGPRPVAALPREPADLQLPTDSGRRESIDEDADDDRQPEPIRSANAAFGAAAGGYAASSRALGLSDSADGGRPTFGDSTTSTDGTGRPGERALEGPQKPALIIQKFAPPEIQVGKPAKFTVQIRNAGSQTAADVVVRDEVPHGTRLIGTSPRAETDGSLLEWKLGALSTGEERTVEIEVMPTAEGEIGSVAMVTCAAQASAKTRCTMPQLAIRMTAPAQVMIGQEQRVKIELRNPGTGDATGVMLFENVPGNVRHAAGPSLEFEVGTLRAGETREMELVLTAENAGPVINTLTARADGNLQVQQQVEFEVIAPALIVSVDGPERRYLERPATYQVRVENPGTAPAHDVELVTKLPKGMQFIRANNMGEYDASTHAVYWSLAQLPEGERGVVELVAMPVESGRQTLEVESKAGQGLADHARQDVMIEGLAAIMFEVRDAEDPIEVGRETSYEIRVVNQGTKAATNVQVVVSLPRGMQFVSASGETRHSAQAGGVVFEPLAQLAPKADSVYRVEARGVQPGDQRVTVQVNTDDITQPIRREESTRVFGDE